MKRLSTLLLLFVLIIPYGISQNDYTVNFANDQYHPEKIETQKYSDSQLIEKVAKHDYQFIQFYKLPSEKEVRSLEKSGIKMIEYLPSNTYAVFIDSVKLKHKSDLDFTNIRSVFPFYSEYKIDKRLTSGKLPEWTEPEFGKVDINVLLFQNYNNENFISYLKQLDIEILKSPNRYNRLTVRVPVQYIDSIANYSAVKWIEPIEPDKELKNSDAQKVQRNNTLTATYPGARSLSGDGIVVGEWDGGKIGTHQDLYGRINNNSEEGEDWHGTHVAGTIIGRGILDPKAEGMAPNAELYASDFVKDLDEIAAEMDEVSSSEGVSITSNSWGYAIDQYICKNPFPYLSSVYYLDDVANNNEKLTHVFANGNDQQVCPGGYWTSSWTMKNAILVGAIDDTSEMSSFSSFGPLFDGRMAPHVCAVGVDVYSTFLDNEYYHSDGTSMAAPAVSGGIALLYEHYDSLYNSSPTSAFIRSVIYNSANDLGIKGPDYKYGYGQLNLRKAVEIIENEDFIQDVVNSGNTNTYTIDIPANAEQLKVTLAWTDEPGTPYAETPLVNDLDLKITKNDDEWLPWVLDKDNPSEAAKRGEDHVSNHEQVTIENPEEGEYTIEVKGTSLPSASGEEFTLAYQVDMPEVKLTYPFGGETINTEEEVYIRWDAESSEEPFDIDLSTDGGNTWENIASNIPGDERSYRYTTPEEYSPEVFIRVSQSDVSDQNEESFSFFGTPENFDAYEQYQGLDVYWDSLPGATSYEVFEAKNGELSKLGTTTDTSFHVDELETGEKYYLTVRARRDEDNITGERAKAISPKPAPKFDLSVYQITEPVSGINLTSEEKISAEILNLGAEDFEEGDTIPVSYSINSGGAIEEEIILDDLFERGDTLEYTFDQTAYMSTYNDYTIAVWTEFPQDTFYTENDKVETRIVNSEPITEFPYEEDFDNFKDLLITDAHDPVYLDNSWNNDHINDDIDWWPNSGSTYKEGTGPYEDHTTGEGKYLYTEAYILDEEPGSAYLFSPGFDISQLDDPTLFFWLHMYSEDSLIGDFHVDIYSVEKDTIYKDITSEVSGNQGKEWHRKIINLTPYKDEGVIRIRFRAEITDHWQNAFAIDDVVLRDLNASDFGIIDIKPDGGYGQLSENEPITVSIVNEGADTLQPDDIIPVAFQCDGKQPVEEEIRLENEVLPFDTLDYEFSQTADLSDLTKRYHFKAWVDGNEDPNSDNDTITDHTVQSYCEPRSDCYSDGSPTGIGTFVMDGIHDQFDLDNTNSLCGTTGLKGYSFYGDKEVKVYTGSDYQMQLRCIVPPPEYDIPIFGEYFKIWIDFDQSGTFEEDELVYENNQRDIDLLTDSIHIPSDALTGKTRLRIRSSYYQDELVSPAQSCSFVSHGETEDYTIEILPYPNVDISLREFTELPHSFPDLSASEQIGITIINKGKQVLQEGTEIPLTYQVNDNDVENVSVALDGSLEQYDTTDVLLDKVIDMSEIGEYKIKLWNELIDDEDEWNDTLTARIHNMETHSGNDYEENFETFENGWFDESDSWEPIWELGTPDQENINKPYDGDAAWMTNLDHNYPNEKTMILYTPAFDLSSMEKPMISFWMYFRTEFNWDGMILEASTDGINWDKVGDEAGLDFYNNTETDNPQWNLGTPWWSGNNGGWNKYELTLNEYGGEDIVLLRFRFKSDLYENDEGVAIDNFSIKEKRTDIGVVEYLNPRDHDNLTDREYIQFKFANLGTTTFTNDEEIDISVSLNNETREYDYQLTSDFLPGDTITYETPSSFDMSEDIDYEVIVNASHPDDMDSSNDEYTHFLEIEEPSGINDYPELIQVDIYPNPTDGKLNIAIEAEVYDSYAITIFNGVGSKIMEKNVEDIQDSKVRLDLSDFESGVYFVNVSNDSINYTKKILIK